MSELNIKKHLFNTSFLEMDIPLQFNNYGTIPLEKYPDNATSYFINRNIIEEQSLQNYKNELIKYINIAGEVLNFYFDRFTRSWFQKYEKINYHPLHTHGSEEGLFCCIHYIQTSDKSANTNFYTPGWPYVCNEESKISIKPKNNKLIVFPSYLPHEVEINKDKTRLIFSANFITRNNK